MLVAEADRERRLVVEDRQVHGQEPLVHAAVRRVEHKVVDAHSPQRAHPVERKVEVAEVDGRDDEVAVRRVLCQHRVERLLHALDDAVRARRPPAVNGVKRQVRRFNVANELDRVRGRQLDVVLGACPTVAVADLRRRKGGNGNVRRRREKRKCAYLHVVQVDRNHGLGRVHGDRVFPADVLPEQPVVPADLAYGD